MNIKKFIVSAAAGALLFSSIAVSAFAATFTNGQFENVTVSGAFDTLPMNDMAGMPGWTVISGSVDHIGSYWVGSPGQSVDLNGLTQGAISQTFDTTSGTVYKVTFDLSGNPDSRPVGDPFWSPSDKVVQVSAGSTPSMNFHYDTSVNGNSLSEMKWESHSYTFIATGASTVLTFASQIPGAFGPALDNVAVTQSQLTKDQCKNCGWQSLGVFKNQGDCVSYVATGGKNLPAGQ